MPRVSVRKARFSWLAGDFADRSVGNSRRRIVWRRWNTMSPASSSLSLCLYLYQTLLQLHLPSSFDYPRIIHSLTETETLGQIFCHLARWETEQRALDLISAATRARIRDLESFPETFFVIQSSPSRLRLDISGPHTDCNKHIYHPR